MKHPDRSTSRSQAPIFHPMQAHELTVGQARVVAHIRASHPHAELLFHERAWGYVLEVREPTPSGRIRTVALARFRDDGTIVRDEHVRLAGAA
jgi:hypothetical protein